LKAPPLAAFATLEGRSGSQHGGAGIGRARDLLHGITEDVRDVASDSIHRFDVVEFRSGSSVDGRRYVVYAANSGGEGARLASAASAFDDPPEP